MASPGGRVDKIVIELALRGAREFQSQVRSANTELASMTKGLKNQQGVLRDNRIGLVGMSTAAAAAGRALSLAGLSLSGIGVGAVGAGLQFNAAMQGNVIALKRFAGGADGAAKELDFLYNLAAKTPFEFQPLVLAERRMLAFGMSVSRSNELMTTLGDTVAAIGGGSDEIRRATIAIGQIQAKNRVFAEELLQLTELGIPAYQIMSEELGIAQANLNRVGDLGIDANTAIDALIRGLTKRYGGAAMEFQASLFGQISTFKDYARQFSGYITMPLFRFLNEKLFPRLTSDIQDLSIALKYGGWEAVAIELDHLYNGDGYLFENLLHGLEQAWDDISTIITVAVIPAFKDLTGDGTVLRDILGLTLRTLHWLALNADDVRTAIKLLVIGYGLWKSAMIIWSIYSKTSFWLKVLRGRTDLLTKSQVAARFAAIGLSKGFKLLGKAMIWLATTAFRAVILGIRLLSLALLSTPAGWIITAVALLAAGLIVLALNSDLVKQKLGEAWEWVTVKFRGWMDEFDKWKMRKVNDFWDWLKAPFVHVLNWLIIKWNEFAKKLSFKFDTHIPGVGEIGMNVPQVDVLNERNRNKPRPGEAYTGITRPGFTPGFAPYVPPGGGQAATGIPAMAPPMRASDLPKPWMLPYAFRPTSPFTAALNPGSNIREDVNAAGGGPSHITIPVHIDGRKVAEAVWHEGRTQQARR